MRPRYLTVRVSVLEPDWLGPKAVIYPANSVFVSIVFASAVKPLNKGFAFGEILSFALPKESIQRKGNPIPLESPLRNIDLRRKRNSRFASVESLKHPFS